MIVERTRTITERHEVTNEELNEALFIMLNPDHNANWTKTKIQEAEELVRLAYKNGYRLKKGE